MKFTEKMETDESQDEVNSTVEDVEEDLDPELPKRKKKPGIVYLSSIPPGMNPQLIRDYLGAHGDVGRMYLEPLDSTYFIFLYFISQTLYNLHLFYTQNFGTLRRGNTSIQKGGLSLNPRGWPKW